MHHARSVRRIVADAWVLVIPTALMNTSFAYPGLRPLTVAFMRILRVARRQVISQAAFSPTWLKRSLGRTRDDFCATFLRCHRSNHA